jgi:hypothetical protein
VVGFPCENGRFFDVNSFDAFAQVVGFLMLKWSVFQLTKTIQEGTSRKYAFWMGLLIFAALSVLFWWADSLYGAFFTRLFKEFFKTLTSGDVNIFRVLLWAYLILGMLLYAGTQSQDEQLFVDNAQFFTRWFSFPYTALVSVILMIPLGFFMAIRTHCVFDPGDCLGPDGFLVWINSGHGFWALMLISVVVFMVVAWLGHVTLFTERLDRLAYLLLNLLIFSFVMFLLVIASVSVNQYTFGITATRHIWYARGAVFWILIMFGMYIGYQYLEREFDFPYMALRVTTGMVAAFVTVGVVIAAV